MHGGVGWGGYGGGGGGGGGHSSAGGGGGGGDALVVGGANPLLTVMATPGLLRIAAMPGERFAVPLPPLSAHPQACGQHTSTSISNSTKLEYKF